MVTPKAYKEIQDIPLSIYGPKTKDLTNGEEM
jgi:hypothetical protein